MAEFTKKENRESVLIRRRFSVAETKKKKRGKEDKMEAFSEELGNCMKEIADLQLSNKSGGCG